MLLCPEEQKGKRIVVFRRPVFLETLGTYCYTFFIFIAWIFLTIEQALPLFLASIHHGRFDKENKGFAINAQPETFRNPRCYTMIYSYEFDSENNK